MKKLGTILLLSLLTACANAVPQSEKIRWYGGTTYNGKPTASGETFYDTRLRFASNYYKFGTRLEITYNGKTAVVTCNDRSPTNKIELTKFAFEFLADPKVGVINAQYKIIN